MKTLQDKLRTLPDARHKKIVARTDQLMREQTTVRELGKPLSMTQAELVKTLNEKQKKFGESKESWTPERKR